MLGKIMAQVPKLSSATQVRSLSSATAELDDSSEIVQLQKRLEELQKIEREAQRFPDIHDNIPQGETCLDREILQLQKTLANKQASAKKESNDSPIFSKSAKKGFVGC